MLGDIRIRASEGPVLGPPWQRPENGLEFPPSSTISPCSERQASEIGNHEFKTVDCLIDCN